LNVSLSPSRQHSRGLRDADFIVTEHDRRGAAGGAAGAARREIPLVVVCDNLRSAFNVGSVPLSPPPFQIAVPTFPLLSEAGLFPGRSIFRTSECVGAKEVVLCGYTATPSDAGTAKAAMGMHELVPWRWERAAADAIAAARAQGLSVVALETAEGCPEAHRFAFPRGGVALVLGNERYGLSPALLEVSPSPLRECTPRENDTSLFFDFRSATHSLILDQSPVEGTKDRAARTARPRRALMRRGVQLCDSVVQLPCRGVKNSLNVGVAFGVTAYEILRQWEMPPP